MNDSSNITKQIELRSAFLRGIDLFEGDVVQIKGPGHNAGRVGRIIGVSYFKRSDDLRFTIMFSDREAKLFSGDRLVLVKRE